MKAARRTVHNGASARKTPGLPPSPVQSKPDCAGTPPWEARLCELESRLAQLESENGKLRDAYHQLEASSATQAKLHDFAPIGLVTLDPRGTVLDINRTAAVLLGRERWSLLQRRFAYLVEAKDLPKFRSFVRRCLRSRQMASGELSLRRTEGGPVVVQFASVPVLDKRSRVLRLDTTLIDVTDRRRTEKALRESEARLQAIMDHSPAMIFLKDRQGRYVHFNRQFEQVFHLPLDQTVGKTDAEIFSPEQAASFRANDLKVIQAGIPMVFDEVTFHDDCPRANIVTRFPLFDGEGKIYAIAGIATDITERRRLEAEVLEISEREQRRIAQDLHDGLGQHLTGVVHLVAGLQARLGERSLAEAADAARIVKLLDDAVAQTRSLARGLHPVPAETGGLMASLEQLAEMVRDLFRTDCRFECPQSVLLPDNVMATHLYRIAQEAVNNAIKHGRASQIRIGLAQTSDWISLTVRNNGGPVPAKRVRKEGLGLRTMQYRASMIGGSLMIVSDARHETTVACMVPHRMALPQTASVS